MIEAHEFYLDDYSAPSYAYASSIFQNVLSVIGSRVMENQILSGIEGRN